MTLSFPKHAFLALALAIAATLAAAADAPRHLEELMARSGLDEQVAQMAASVKEGARQANEQPGLPRKMSPRDLHLLYRAIDAAYGADALRRGTRDELGKLLSVEDERAALAWLDSPLGKRFTRMEVEAGEPQSPEEAQKAAKAYLASAPASRVDRIRRLIVSVDAAEAITNSTLNVMAGTALGIALEDPSLDVEVVARLIKEKIEPQRVPMKAFYERALLETLAFAYRKSDDEELDAYIRFAETPSGRRYHGATMKAVDAAFSRASFEMGRHFQQLRKSPERAS